MSGVDEISPGLVNLSTDEPTNSSDTIPPKLPSFNKRTKLGDVAEAHEWAKDALGLLQRKFPMVGWNELTLDAILKWKSPVKYSDQHLLIYVKAEITEHLASVEFHVKDVVELVIYDNSDTLERVALQGTFVPELSVMSGNAIEHLKRAADAATESFAGYGYKSIVMTGESGIGKTVCATHTLRDEFTPKDSNSGGTTFYAKISNDPCFERNYTEMPDSPEKKNDHNKLALEWLQKMFTDCCKQLVKKHQQLADGNSAYEKRGNLWVVVVVDECGGHWLPCCW